MNLIKIFIGTLMIFTCPYLVRAFTSFDEMKWHAEKGDARAQCIIGLAYFLGAYRDGTPIKKDTEEALKWFHLSAENGFSYAQFHLGGMYLEGNGVEQNYQLATRWLLESAKGGNVKARTNIAICYFEGKGVEQDDMKAYAWASLAAFKGNKNAQNLVQKILPRLKNRKKADNLATKYFKRYGPGNSNDE